MIEAVLHLFKIHGKVIFGNPAINAFACGAPSALALASAAKVSLIHPNFSLKACQLIVRPHGRSILAVYGTLE